MAKPIAGPIAGHQARRVSRKALNPSYEPSFLLDFRSPTEGMAERREAVSFILSRA
jgi:hypothetical protein